MVLDRWDPFRELRRMEETMDRLWRGLGPTAGGPNSDVEHWGIPLDVLRDGDTVVVKASVPGVKPSDIEVTIADNVLTVSGKTSTEEEHKEGNYLMRERRTGTFQRSIRLPDTIDANQAESSYESGVLTIRLPKTEASKPKQLKIDVKDGKAIEGKK